jgi:hypothetical protein
MRESRSKNRRTYIQDAAEKHCIYLNTAFELIVVVLLPHVSLLGLVDLFSVSGPRIAVGP